MRTPFNPARRMLMRVALSAGALGPLATLSFAGTSSPGSSRFVMIILRGGMDGLYAVPAVGDPDFAPARGMLAQYPTAPLPLDATFALHPNLAQLHAMYGRGELNVVHAVGLPYHERSHFDAQQVLESGGTRPYELASGWLGRALGAGSAKGLALSTTVPLVLRGPGIVDTWAPSALPDPSVDLVTRLERMYGSDPALATALARAKALHFDAAMMAEVNDAPMRGDGAHRPGGFVALARRAAEFLSQSNGPKAAVLELGGWDSHANQAAPNGATAVNLRHLDAGLAALRDGLLAGRVWRDTVVLVATEFGREVAINGTLGTDHGSGGAVFVLGGAIKGGRVFADWPGLAKKDRFEGRDLRTTTDLRAVLKGVLGEHLQMSSRSLNAEVFPGSDAVRAMAVLA
jgi:uncharacterized protein (DUF1501 family)